MRSFSFSVSFCRTSASLLPETVVPIIPGSSAVHGSSNIAGLTEAYHSYLGLGGGGGAITTLGAIGGAITTLGGGGGMCLDRGGGVWW